MSILDMSKAAVPLILAILLARAALIHRLPKRTFPALWGLALLRLLVPLSIPSRLSIQTMLAGIAALFTTQTAPVAVTPLAMAPNVTTQTVNTMLLPRLTILPVPTAQPAPTPFPWLAAIWLGVACLIALSLTVSYLRSRRRFAASLPAHTPYLDAWLAEHPTRRRVTIRYSDQIISPLTYGILRPVILLPKNALTLRADRLGCILTHEMTHIRRLDALYKLLLAAAFCVHWFNPLVWLMVHLASRDLELACDQAVVQSLSKARKSSYAMTLIDMEERRSQVSPLLASFSKNATEERIHAIMKMKHTTRLGAILALILVLMMAVVFATSALATEEGTDSTEVVEDAAQVTEAAETAAEVEPAEMAEDVQTITITRGGNIVYATPSSALQLETYSYEEFKAWLDEERDALDALVQEGAKGWTAADGTFTWTKEMVDETLAPYEDMLESIENGALIAKPAELSDDVTISIARATEAFPAAGISSFYTYGDADSYTVTESYQSGPMAATVVEAMPSTRIYRHHDAGQTYSIQGRSGLAAGTAQYMATIAVSDQLTVDVGPYETEEALAEAVRAFCDSQVAAGLMEQADADAITKDYE